MADLRKRDISRFIVIYLRDLSWKSLDGSFWVWCSSPHQLSKDHFELLQPQHCCLPNFAARALLSISTELSC